MVMSIIQPNRIGCGDDITPMYEDTTTTVSVDATTTIKRACKTKDCGDTKTPTVMEKKKRACKRRDCGDTNTPDVMETKKRAYKRKDCSDTTTPAVMKTKKRAYKRKDLGDTNTPAVMETKKIAYKRKDRGDTITPTVMETKKRAYKRKDCGDTNTPAVMETKKRACKRKDSGDTITPTVMETTKKRTCKRKDCGDTNTPAVMEKNKRACRSKTYLPHDLIMEEILTKVPVPTLRLSALVSKLWYNSIHNDHKRLTYSHFLQSQKQPQVVLRLSNVRAAVDTKTGDANYGCHFFKITNGLYSHDNVLRFERFQTGLTHPYIWELVGYCNGLPCMAQVGNYTTAYVVLDPNRDDFLLVFYPASVGKRISNAHIICHGFGFDSLANEYKLVSVFRTAGKELNFVVFTLGTKSWRNVTATSTTVSGHAGRSIIKISAPSGSDKSAIFCTTSGGCLVWKITTTLGGAGSNSIQHDNRNAVNSETEMLLSFNLHDEKFQFIQLPAKSTTDEQQKHLLVDYPHLLEFKGSPCIARIEKSSGNGSEYPHRRRDGHHGGGSSSSCCCCCKVHLYVMKDKVKEEWVKEESFDVRISSTSTWLGHLGHLASDPCCFCFGNTTTRIFSFSDQMLLYWFNGNYLQVYNMRSEKHQLVLPGFYTEDRFFQAKMKEPRHVFISGDDDIYCSNMDYQLHRHEDNFLSLQTFIPEGVAGVDADVFHELDLKNQDRPCLAYVCISKGSRVFYPFFLISTHMY